jgi:ABC-type multidrug transport system fused ATPase/permease subunit
MCGHAVIVCLMLKSCLGCRLSTIRNADLIVAFKKGEVVEKGTHNELIQNPRGFYSNLVASQMNAH